MSIPIMQLRSLQHSVQLQSRGDWYIKTRCNRSPRAFAICALNKLGVPTGRDARYPVIIQNLETLIGRLSA